MAFTFPSTEKPGEWMLRLRHSHSFAGAHKLERTLLRKSRFHSFSWIVIIHKIKRRQYDLTYLYSLCVYLTNYKNISYNKLLVHFCLQMFDGNHSPQILSLAYFPP